ncbi:MAG: tRNA (guanosine(37)-N1)-methyltransferase TrmD [Candidatus Wildermuthbacteria bacterium]|nr:tRNA (guanosine(37)-N1)-methyltransferase TrmD [Candidatus Wildermuthbacteria bacterium]
MKFDIITIFPQIFDSYFAESLLKRAQEKKLLEIRVHNLRDWTEDSHKTVDDSPFGGGLGMVMKIEPIYKAVIGLKSQGSNSKAQANPKFPNLKQRVILFTPRGKKFTQRKAHEYAKLDQLIMICGRYEGVDERVGKYIADEQLSIGDYDLMGGELPAMIVVETVSRLIPGVIGKEEFLKEHIKDGGFIEYPQYTRPEVFVDAKRKKRTVPQVLLSGNHKKIEEWRQRHEKLIK